MKEKIKVLFIDDRQTEFDRLEDVFAVCDYFELINKIACFDEGSRDVYTRECQKKTIKELFEKESDNYQVILFDISLRNGRDENFTLGMLDNLLSLEIYKEMEEWIKKQGKKFVFVTSHQILKEEESITRLKKLLPNVHFLRKAIDKNEYRLACKGYDECGKTLCGNQFNYCRDVDCFNKVLRRIVEVG